MRADEHRRLYEFEDKYWWFLGRKVILAEMLRSVWPEGLRRILDVGCGAGATMLALREFGPVVGLDAAALALEFCRERGHPALVQGLAEALPFSAGQFDLITSLDVLEHLDDDVGALAEIHRLLPEGGRLLLAVPAYQFLWSEHDEALSHRRRYTAPEVRSKLERVGFTIERLSYAITLLFPVVLALRLGQRFLKRRREPRTALMELPGPLNRLCYRSLVWEAGWLRRWNLPVGVSVLCLARRLEPQAASP